MEPPGGRESAGRADGADVIEAGGRPVPWPRLGPRGMTATVAVAALIAGLLVGFLGGHLTAGTASRQAAAAARSAAALPLGPAAIAFTGSRCAVQHGRTLQLGIEITNQSGSAVAVGRVRPVLPLGGLRPVASQWGPCGSLPGPGPEQPASLPPGATAWVAITFDVLVRCPAALPVQFNVRFRQSGKTAAAQLDSFPDLGPVPYSGCGTHG
jgi:hypothetical protein